MARSLYTLYYNCFLSQTFYYVHLAAVATMHRVLSKPAFIESSMITWMVLYVFSINTTQGHGTINDSGTLSLEMGFVEVIVIVLDCTSIVTDCTSFTL